MKLANSSHQYYLENTQYSEFLESQNLSAFSKYIEAIKNHASPEQKVLDVGCGTGIVLQGLKRLGFKKMVGMEISRTSVEVCKKKGFDCYQYGGFTFPFDDQNFDLVGSINVLEHTDNPIKFLDEQYRVLKRNGYLIVACPNFLSTTNSYHKHTRGIANKVRNAIMLMRYAFTKEFSFKKMEMTIRTPFQPDDDAVNVTNPIQLTSWAKMRKMHIVYTSAFQAKKTGLLEFLDHTPLRVFFGSCFYILQKK
ncbi:MAG: class I SAM-dependent methyltransferase [Candidatus Roizmanbacteria bacterium]